MAIVLSCSSGHRLKVPSKYAGKRVVCPVCGNGIEVPRVEPEPNTMGPAKVVAPPELSTPPTSTPLPTEPTPEPTPTAQQSVPESVEVPSPIPTTASITPAPTTGEPKLEHETELPPQIEEQSAETPPSLPPTEVEHQFDFPHIIVDDYDSDDRVASSHFITDSVTAKSHSVFTICFAAILLAILSSVPAIFEQFSARSVGIRSPDIWSYYVVLGSIVLIAIATFTMRIPDWSTTWILCLSVTLLATVYAAILGMTMFATQSHYALRQIGLLHEAFKYQAQPWCFVVMCALLSLAFFCGRHSYRSYRDEQELVF